MKPSRNFLRSVSRLSHSTRKERCRLRSGSIYIVAMGTSLIVVCLAIASLQSVRVQRRFNNEQSEMVHAKKLAQAGIEFAQQQILTDANWRNTFQNGVPVTRNTTGGSFSVTLTDPGDGNLGNQSTDSIVVSCTGNFRTSSQKWTAYIEPQLQLYAACRSSLYAPTSIEFSKCTITANQWAYSDGQFNESGNSTVNVNCMSTGNLSGNAYKQRAIQGGTWPMEAPNMNISSPNYVGKYYIDNSVVINVTDLPTGGTELINNGGFETDTANWSALNCTLTRDTSQKRIGNASCRVSGQGFLSSPVQRIAEPMTKGRNYNVSFWIRTTEDQTIAPVLSFTGSASPIPVLKSGPSVVAQSGVWTQLTGTINASWNGNLTKAEFAISSEKDTDYHFDGVSVVDADRQAGTRYIENVLLGSGNNPYGTKTVSTNGIYSINAGAEKILIRDCRINGTIVVTSASKVELGNALSWEPAGRNFPSLIANTPVDDLTSIATLSEATVGFNGNPTSAPYLGVSDNDTSDSYPSVINGPIVNTSNILLKGIAVLSGPVMAAQTIRVESDSLNINFQSDMILNPPPGFFANPPKMRLITSSVQSSP